MNLYLFKINTRLGKKEISVYQYPTISEELDLKIRDGIEVFLEKTSEYETAEYNPLIDHKEKLQRITLEELKNDGVNFKVIHYYLEEESPFENDLAKLKILETNNEILESISFFIVEVDGSFYFRRFLNSAFLKQTKIVTAYDSTANTLDMINKKLVVFDTTFDFYLESGSNEVLINNSINFEYIAGYNEFFESKKREVMNHIAEIDLLNNFEEFKKESEKKKYLRLFSRVKLENIEELKQQSDFLGKLSEETAGEIVYNEEEEKFTVNTKHTKTILHLFTYLIGIDMTNKIVIYQDREYIRFLE
ncbi:Kiwa anti-phage protein KwaB-like domain-containing protein [Planococcus rifietoensis]|uniref:Kiwa anti-phage protein KwaB-like domain-containing protein n=1 Tax=Planococcus rifietoensis TaxID=200991 RepID=UPI00384EC874